jgi:hypothetical protein
MYTFDVLQSPFAPKLVLTVYSEEARATKRHGFKNTGKYWHRLQKNKCTIKIRPDVPIEVKIRAKQAFIERIEMDF